jgi:DNA modification methylase/ParB-like chromosome segregation protein Spo0J
VTTINELNSHPAAKSFPMMDDGRYSELLADIRENGQREPITLCEGMILDGRNRYRACLEAGLEPITRNFDGDPWAFAWSLNGARRDLEDIVRALIYRRCQEGSAEWAKRLAKIAEEGNRKKSEAAKKQHAKSNPRRGETLVVDHSDQPPKRKVAVAREARATGAKVSPATMGRADQIAQRPDLAKKVIEGEITPAAALREIRSAKRRQELKEAAAKAAAVQHERDRPSWSILNLDVMDGLESVRDEHGPARLIFTDPPYNIGIDYGAGEDADRLTDAAYMKWVRKWFALCWDCLAEDGSLWVMIGDEYAAEYAVELKSTGFTLRSWIKWYETFGVNCSNKFNRTSRHIFYAVKDPARFVFNPEPVTRPSDRQTKYGDSRAAAGGKLWDDGWQIPRLTGTCAERMPDPVGGLLLPTQLPLSLVQPIVLCASMPGDLVVDPFNGTGTTGVAAVRNGRKYVGIEKNEKFADMANQRITAS